MNRTIKFRGLRTDGKGWVYGDLVNSHEGTHIVESEYFKPSNDEPPTLINIIPSSVGQFTSLLDKDGREIYEGDKVLAKWETDAKGGYLQSSDSYVEHTQTAIVVWHNNGFLFQREDGKFISLPSSATLTITGNIHKQ